MTPLQLSTKDYLISGTRKGGAYSSSRVAYLTKGGLFDGGVFEGVNKLLL